MLWNLFRTPSTCSRLDQIEIETPRAQKLRHRESRGAWRIYLWCRCHPYVIALKAGTRRSSKRSNQNNEEYQTKALEDPKMKVIAQDFAMFYEAEGFYAKAEKLFGQSVAAWEAEAGPEHPDTLRAVGSLATVYAK